jgi:membrane protein implicated in regulation of membrane protease activity
MLPQMEFIVEKIESLLILVAVLEITYFIALAALLLALGRLFLSIFSSPASRASQRATREFSETAILKKYLKNLKAQFKQADEVVKNLERLI